MSNDSQVDEFMAELYDKFYPQVMQGLEEMQQGNVHTGIETLSRPLHTIKGVTGFMGGFEPASTFTHKVESFLKKIQSDEVTLNDSVASAAIASVNMVFQIIEQIRDSGAGPQAEMDDMLERIRQLGETAPPAEDTGSGGVRLARAGNAMVARIDMPRLHLPEQRQALLDVLQQQQDGVPLVLDFSAVLSAASSLWEMMEPFTGRFPIHVAGMCPAVRGTLSGWGYDALFREHRSVEACIGDAAECVSDLAGQDGEEA